MAAAVSGATGGIRRPTGTSSAREAGPTGPPARAGRHRSPGARKLASRVPRWRAPDATRPWRRCNAWSIMALKTRLGSQDTPRRGQGWGGMVPPQVPPPDGRAAIRHATGERDASAVGRGKAGTMAARPPQIQRRAQPRRDVTARPPHPAARRVRLRRALPAVRTTATVRPGDGRLRSSGRPGSPRLSDCPCLGSSGPPPARSSRPSTRRRPS